MGRNGNLRRQGCAGCCGGCRKFTHGRKHRYDQRTCAATHGHPQPGRVTLRSGTQDKDVVDDFQPLEGETLEPPQVGYMAAKAATRQYAKRQMTWFRQRMKDWEWIETTDADAIAAKMLAAL